MNYFKQNRFKIYDFLHKTAIVVLATTSIGLTGLVGIFYYQFKTS